MITTTNNTALEVTPYNDEELAYFKSIILTKLAEAEENLQEVKVAMESSVDGNSDDSAYSAHIADVAMIEHDRAVNYMLYQRTQKFIRQLLAALDRINNKTYGICKFTGLAIPKGRLEAVPHTRQIIERKIGFDHRRN